MRPLAPAAWLVLALSVSAYARTWHITPDGTGDAPTIQAGIDSAAVTDTVLVAIGTHYEHDIVLRSDVSVIGERSGADLPIIDAQRLGRCLLGTRIRSGTLIANLDMINAYVPGGSFGAAVFLERSSPVLRNCRMRNSEAVRGAGLFLERSFPLVDSCEFSSNLAQRGGGAMALGPSLPEFRDCVFAGNLATHEAGALLLAGPGRVVQCVFENNESLDAGPPTGGGAISITSGTPEIRGCLFVNNTGSHTGAAIYAHGGSSPVIFACDFIGNSTGHGGAIAVREASAAIDGCLVWDNSAVGVGAFLWLHDSVATVSSCTVVGNSHGTDGTFYVSYSALHLNHTVVTGNLGTTTVECYGDSEVEIACTDIWANPGGGWDGCIAEDAGASGNISADPLFCDAASGDFHLQWDSPCLPANSNGCDLIGRYGFGGCNSVSVTPDTWGHVKARFRTDLSRAPQPR